MAVLPRPLRSDGGLVPRDRATRLAERLVAGRRGRIRTIAILRVRAVGRDGVRVRCSATDRRRIHRPIRHRTRQRATEGLAPPRDCRRLSCVRPWVLRAGGGLGSHGSSNQGTSGWRSLRRHGRKEMDVRRPSCRLPVVDLPHRHVGESSSWIDALGGSHVEPGNRGASDRNPRWASTQRGPSHRGSGSGREPHWR